MTTSLRAVFAPCDPTEEDAQGTWVGRQMLRSLGQEPASVGVAGFGDRSVAADVGRLSGGRHQPAIDALIVAYCVSEGCSAYALAAKAAIHLGYNNVKRFAPGLAGWKAAGEPLQRGSVTIGPSLHRGFGHSQTKKRMFAATFLE
jgi:rhodanese-related sulfurtransferase